jgi:hypothetical protein
MGVRLYCIVLVLFAWALLAHALGGSADPISKVMHVWAALRPEILGRLEAYAGEARCLLASASTPASDSDPQTC